MHIESVHRCGAASTIWRQAQRDAAPGRQSCSINAQSVVCGPCMLTRLTVTAPSRRTLRARCRLAMVRTRRFEDLQCGDGRLPNSPCPPSAASCASCATWDAEPQPPEEFPFPSMDEDHEAGLALMQLRETREAPAHNWLVPKGHQKVLSAKHRRFLVSWLSRACEAHHFAIGTLALAVSLLDRFLQRTAVRQEDAWAVQLTAVACLSIAAKFEEVNVPYSVAKFQVEAPWEPLFLGAHVMAMELAVLRAIDWRVQAGALAPEFLDRLLHVANVRSDGRQNLQPHVMHAARNTAQSLIVAALHDERCMTTLPSCTAGAAMLLGMSVNCNMAATAAAYACLSRHLPAGTLRDCMQHMRFQLWGLDEPQPPLAAAAVGSVTASEADCESPHIAQITSAPPKLHARATGAPAASQQCGLRRSSRLQQCKAVQTVGEGLIIVKGPSDVHSVAETAPESGSPSVRSAATVFPGSSGRGVAAFSPLEPSNKERSQSVCWPSCQ